MRNLFIGLLCALSVFLAVPATAGSITDCKSMITGLGDCNDLTDKDRLCVAIFSKPISCETICAQTYRGTQIAVCIPCCVQTKRSLNIPESFDIHIQE